jgi:hypothetical protein
VTVLSVSQIAGPMLAPAPIAPSSGGPVGSGLGGAIHNTWVDAGRAKEVKNRAERRAALRKAVAKVEARAQTKQERLASASKAARTTGSESERRDTRGSVAKAAAAVEGIPSDKEFSNDDFRRVREKLRQTYPGRSLSSMLVEAQKLEQMLLDDPVNAHAALFAAYSRAAPAAEYVEPVHAKGLRGSLARARQDQADSEDLKDWVARFGKRLPSILAELEATDRALRSNPNFEAAKLAARHGAPVLEHEVAPYEAKQATKAHQKRYNDICKGIDLAIQHKLIPGDDEHLANIVHVLQHTSFPHHETDGLKTLRAASAIASRLPKAAPAKRSDAGTKSISGGPGPGQGGRPSYASRDKGTGSIRDSVRRVRESM